MALTWGGFSSSSLQTSSWRTPLLLPRPPLPANQSLLVTNIKASFFFFFFVSFFFFKHSWTCLSKPYKPPTPRVLCS